MSDLIKSGNGQVPDYIPQHRTAKIGNIDETDVQVPRVKLLQGISPELETYNEAKAGHFWHTTASMLMGTELTFIPILVRKTYVLWAPRNDPRGVLARAMDGKTWDVKDVFTVRPKGVIKDLLWDTTSGSVAASGLDQFGTSDPSNPKSAPAASLTYQILMYFVEYPELSPAIVLNTRSAVRAAQDLFGKIGMRQIDHFGQRFRMVATKEQGMEGPYNGYRYLADGYATKEEYELCGSLHKRYSELNFRASDEGDERAEGGATSSAF